MKTIRFMLAGAIALMAFAGCSDDVEELVLPDQENNQYQEDDQELEDYGETEFDENYYAENASISSSDAHYTDTDDGGTVSFELSGGEIVIDVDCGTEWTVQNSAEDIFECSIQPTSVTITAGQNLVEEEVTGIITFMTMPSQIEFATITVTQDGLAYITLSEESLEFDSNGGEAIVTVESNYDWEYSYEAEWLSVTKNVDGNSLTITCNANQTDSSRETVITFISGDGAANIAEAELKITQEPYAIETGDALILEYTITSSNVSISLPITGSDIIVDWGDGTTSNSSSHTYSNSGIYTVTISGSIGGLCCWDFSCGERISGSEYLSTVIQWGNVNFTSMESVFRSCTSLKSLPEGVGPFSNVTSMESAFCECTSLTKLPEGIFSNCPAVKDFNRTFFKCSSLVSAPSFQGCPAAISFEYTFFECTALTTVPENMFSGCSAVKRFDKTFYDCISLVSAPSFEACTGATSFFETFYNCSSLVSAPSFEELSIVTTFEQTFCGCTALTTVPENMFSGCKVVKSFDGTFAKCSSLVSAPSFEGCSEVTTFGNTFYGCTALTTVPEKMFSSCSAAKSFYRTFYKCSALKTVSVDIFDGTSSAYKFGETFYGCSSVEGESPYTEFEINGENKKIHLYERGDYYLEINYSAPTSHDNCFTGSTFSDIDSIPSSWGGNGD